ncbi:MAG: glycosyltransferase family 39 protein [Ignavibacteria bacterium]|nr:glycosyltransferase family 39 protein [Ignavibacteria bacterium]
MKKFAYSIVIVLIVLILTIGVALFFLNYSTICGIVDGIFNDPLKLTHFKEKYLSASKFLVIKWSLTIVVIVLLMGILYWRKSLKVRIEIIINELLVGMQGFYQSFHLLDKITQRTLAGIIFIAFSFSLYFAVTSPIFIDEVITFKDFTKNSLFVSLSYYPQPNNHVFYSFLTNISYSIFPFSPKISIRLINVLLSVFTNLLFFRLSTKFLSDRASLISTTVFAFLFMNLLYSFQARGYEILLFATIVIFYYLFQFLQFEGGKKYLSVYILASIIGFWAIPSFLYPFCILTSYVIFQLLRRNKFNLILQVIISSAIISCCTIIVYSPVLLISGLKSIVGNYYTMPIPRGEVAVRLLPHFLSTAKWLVAMPSEYISIAVVGVALVLLVHAAKTKKSHFTVLIALLLAPPVLLLLHSVIPFERSWIFLSIPFSIAMGWLADNCNVLRRPLVLYSTISVLIIGLVLLFQTRHYEFYSRDYCLEELTQHIDTSRSKSIGYDSDYDAETFRFALFSLNNNQRYTLMEQLTDSSSYDKYDIVLINDTHPHRSKLYIIDSSHILMAKTVCGISFYQRVK